MKEINAFVGHSFADEDDQVVRTFLDYFDEVQKMGLGFSWDHAKPSEAKDLATKVLSKIEGKNLFIGICTRKEIVIDATNLNRSLMRPSRVTAEKDHFKWMTSDWITQEIGLAIGRGMDLMILLEEDVRNPGGLQGNHEYVVFSRKAPEKSFTKILQMIRSLIPKVPGTAVEAIPPDFSPKPHERVEQGPWEPQNDWTSDKYEFAYLHMIAMEDEAGAAEIDRAYQESANWQQPDARIRWDAAKESCRLAVGKNGSLSKLESMATIHPENSDVHRFLAEAYAAYDQPSKAAARFERAAELADTPEKKMARYGDAILALQQAADDINAERLIDRIKSLADGTQKSETILINYLRRYSEKQGNRDAVFGLYERLLEISPDDADTRFSLAYSYSQSDLEHLSLLHYEKIPFRNRSGAAWNNLGVQYDHFDLVGRSVQAYRHAEEAGETLAMGNLAFKLIGGGFTREATAICTEAMKVENFDNQVNRAMLAVNELPAEETKKKEEIVTNASALSRFFANFGRASLKQNFPHSRGTWLGPDCELSFTIDRNRFTAVGEYYKPTKRGLLANALFGNSDPSDELYHVTYSGAIAGHTVRGTVRRDRKNAVAPPPSLLGVIDNEYEVLIILSEKGPILVWERGKGKDQTFYAFDQQPI